MPDPHPRGWPVGILQQLQRRLRPRRRPRDRAERDDSFGDCNRGGTVAASEVDCVRASDCQSLVRDQLCDFRAGRPQLPRPQSSDSSRLRADALWRRPADAAIFLASRHLRRGCDLCRGCRRVDLGGSSTDDVSGDLCRPASGIADVPVLSADALLRHSCCRRVHGADCGRRHPSPAARWAWRRKK